MAEIVHDEDVARSEGRHQELAAVGQRAPAVDWTVEDTGRREVPKPMMLKIAPTC